MEKVIIRPCGEGSDSQWRDYLVHTNPVNVLRAVWREMYPEEFKEAIKYIIADELTGPNPRDILLESGKVKRYTNYER